MECFLRLSIIIYIYICARLWPFAFSRDVDAKERKKKEIFQVLIERTNNTNVTLNEVKFNFPPRLLKNMIINIIFFLIILKD